MVTRHTTWLPVIPIGQAWPTRGVGSLAYRLEVKIVGKKKEFFLGWSLAESQSSASRAAMVVGRAARD